MRSKKPHLLPDGSELVIGGVIAAAIGFVLFYLDFPWFSYTSASILVFLGFSFTVRIWSEDDRAFMKAATLSEEATAVLDEVEENIRYVRKRGVQGVIKEGVQLARQIIDELRQMKPSKFYGGMTQVAPHITRMQSVMEYLDIQEHPRKAGDKYEELMLKSEQGFEGFRQEMERMLPRVTAGDVFNLTTQVELLRSLRNLLQRDEK